MHRTVGLLRGFVHDTSARRMDQEEATRVVGRCSCWADGLQPAAGAQPDLVLREVYVQRGHTSGASEWKSSGSDGARTDERGIGRSTEHGCLIKHLSPDGEFLLIGDQFNIWSLPHL